MSINSHSDFVLKRRFDFNFCSSTFELGFGTTYLFIVALEWRSLDRSQDWINQVLSGAAFVYHKRLFVKYCKK